MQKSDSYVKSLSVANKQINAQESLIQGAGGVIHTKNSVENETSCSIYCE
ncbi:hypothetical protein yberc0001_28000 [Yersinia bercovieri ATCC 43970]|uniref:Uncharacterized protein n=1 Tax=Yersinia bercovieri ATCC 43970 TaxID=349968 RepID=A0ABM9XYC9_YERBE|nr:hypothetical protein yberc0001_28000 [Yersinia bercovieri ATCC 43970]